MDASESTKLLEARAGAPTVDLEDGIAPAEPVIPEETGIDATVLRNLSLKLAHTTRGFTTTWAAERLCLRENIVDDLLQDLVRDGYLEIRGEQDAFSFRYSITGRGSAEASRLREVSGHAGPAPVSVDSYSEILLRQLDRLPPVRPGDVAEAVREMVLPEDAVRVAGVAVASGRSLFLHGPAGNGKTSLGRLLHGALSGSIWIPRAIGVEDQVIRVFDPLCHERIPGSDSVQGVDRRWVRIRRPLIVLGGELLLEHLDLAHSPSLRMYEAPVHMKSNGGLLLVDDFGRERVSPHELLNRWISPLEYGVDHLTLLTGQQVRVPFRQILVVATNLDLSTVTDSAFLRRIGYRLSLENPTPRAFEEIFRRHAERRGVAVPEGLIGRILERYAREGREIRSCHPRDLIDRALEHCRFLEEAPRLTTERLDLAWTGYFGVGAPSS